MAVVSTYSQPKVRKFPQPKLLTYDDYVRLTPPDSGNYELRNGKIIYMPSPTTQHQRLSSRLNILLGNFIMQNQLGEIFAAPMDTKFTEIDTFQPDLLFVSNKKLSIIEEKRINGVPDLVIEILSPSNDAKEMSYKKHIYESSGVAEYWLINLEKKTLVQYERVEDELRWSKTLFSTDTLISKVLSGFELHLNQIFS